MSSEIQKRPELALKEKDALHDWADEEQVQAADIDATIRETGMEVLSAKKLRGYRKLAEMLQKVGMVEVERGKLLHRQDSLERARNAVVEIIINRDLLAEDRIKAATALQVLVKQENETTEMNIKLEQIAAGIRQQDGVRPLPPPGVNIMISTPTQPKVETSVEEDIVEGI